MDRKRLIVLGDAIRGIGMLLIAFAARGKVFATIGGVICELIDLSTLIIANTIIAILIIYAIFINPKVKNFLIYDPKKVYL